MDWAVILKLPLGAPVAGFTEPVKLYGGPCQTALASLMRTWLRLGTVQ